MRRHLAFIFTCAIFVCGSGYACAGVGVEHAWVRMLPPVVDTAAAYMVLRNEGGKVVAPVRDLHQSVQDPARRFYEQAMDFVKNKQFADAATLFQQASEQGNRRAQYQLGLLYARGDGVQKNLVRARELLHKAAMQGHPKAQFYLGQMYVFGDGGEKDNIKATMWFWLATTLGDRFAKDSLRVMTGKISSHDLTEAKKQARILWRKIPHDMKIKHRMTMH